MRCLTQPGDRGAGLTLIPGMPPDLPGLDRSGSEKTQLPVWGSEPVWHTMPPAEPITIVGRESEGEGEGGSCLFPPSSSELQAGVAAPPCLGAPGPEKTSEPHNLCDSLQKTRSIRGVSSFKAASPPLGELEERLLEYSVETSSSGF